MVSGIPAREADLVLKLFIIFIGKTKKLIEEYNLGLVARPSNIYDFEKAFNEIFDSSFNFNPNLNRLVEEGMNFTNAFASASVCTPTRYAMLTGQYSWRTKLKSGVINSCDPLLISRDTFTIGKYLQNIGSSLHIQGTQL